MTSLVSARSNERSNLVERVLAARLPSPEERHAIREAAGVTLDEMAAELRVTAVTVHRWERGRAAPRRSHAIAYRQLLDDLSALTDGAA